MAYNIYCMNYMVSSLMLGGTHIYVALIKIEDSGLRIKSFFFNSVRLIRSIVANRFNRGIEMKEKLQRRKSLDRRRLEEAFLLYAVLKVHFAYDLNVDHIDYDRNVLVQKVTETFRERFLEKWSGKLFSKQYDRTAY